MVLTCQSHVCMAVELLTFISQRAVKLLAGGDGRVLGVVGSVPRINLSQVDLAESFMSLCHGAWLRGFLVTL